MITTCYEFAPKDFVFSSLKYLQYFPTEPHVPGVIILGIIFFWFYMQANKRAVPGTIASQVRSLRKTNSDQVAVAIDVDPDSGKLDDEDDDKGNDFLLLVHFESFWLLSMFNVFYCLVFLSYIATRVQCL